ncbi:hypothetical protein [Streptomyces guryensis]|uniref:Uncharacterized protein n=1 Tax=Streptomyces guryensis TaxID=2886947 RepID=A0A9Q3ZAJ4_9ACTN|nr:hypothetical protein [Streptomyces guryensis]MCD9875415.1 hypothetical protein [Streptomyces guryensis]
MRGADGVTDEGVPAQSGTGAEGSVTGVVRRRWGVALGGVLPARFFEPGWAYEERVERRCPVCEGELHALRRPYESQGRVYRYAALVCPGCPTAFSLADLGVKTYDQLTAASSAAVSVRWGPARVVPGSA